MQFTIDSKTLADALTSVSKAIPAKPTHPILAFVHLTAVYDGLILKGFDLNLGIQKKISATVDIQGNVCLPANLLAQIVGKIDGVINCKYNNETQTMAINSQGSRFNLRGESTDEYPDFPESLEENKLVLPTAILERALRATITTASNDESKQILMGVCINSLSGQLELASTDGHRLSVLKTNYEVDNQLSVVPHSKMLSAVMGFLDHSETTFTWDETLITFKSGDNIVVGRILSGAYPQYNQLLPNQFKRKMTVNAKDLKLALDRVQVMLDKKNNMVKWSFSDNTLTLESVATELGTAKATMSIQQDDNTYFEIGFNAKYLMDCLRSLDGDKLTFHFNEPTQPVIITDDSGDDHTYLIMPVKL